MHLDQRRQARSVASAWKCFNCASLKIATISRIASAPHSIASRICRSSMMKSFRSSGNFTAARIASGSRASPGRTSRPSAPTDSLRPRPRIPGRSALDRKSGRITPADGEAFLTSAIRRSDRPLARAGAGKIAPPSPRLESRLQIGNRRASAAAAAPPRASSLQQ